VTRPGSFLTGALLRERFVTRPGSFLTGALLRERLSGNGP